MEEFNKWAAEMSRVLAKRFAECDDSEEIVNVLERYNRLWFTKACHEISMARQTEGLVTAMNRIGEESR